MNAPMPEDVFILLVIVFMLIVVVRVQHAKISDMTKANTILTRACKDAEEALDRIADVQLGDISSDEELLLKFGLDKKSLLP